MDTRTASDFAHSVVRDGFAPHQAALTLFLAEAGRLGVSQVMVAVAGDLDEPLVTRQRALGGVLVAMASIGPVAVAEPVSQASPEPSLRIARQDRAA